MNSNFGCSFELQKIPEQGLGYHFERPTFVFVEIAGHLDRPCRLEVDAYSLSFDSILYCERELSRLPEFYGITCVK